MSYCDGCQPLSFCDLFKNPCQISELQLEADADIRANSSVYFMGTTKHGYQRPIMEAINPSCKDPVVGKPALKEFLPKPGDLDYARQAERFHFIDIYSGLVNGVNYGKFQRLYGHKRRHARPEFGPNQKFCVPICSSMDYGWWQRDLNCLDRTNWYKPNERHPQKRSEMTIFVDEMGRTTPNFRLF
ncbi:hypothetical protein Ocin01_12732 [Orchesella cincta]|uniref:Uncharacterized protein n=1 Tax=Orchesella cincta TaxID=48709 RepID=A0A1D2MLK4_ORCCI|nr:hypothetical protein Ocin01_12732 [Orchesella cincta]